MDEDPRYQSMLATLRKIQFKPGDRFTMELSYDVSMDDMNALRRYLSREVGCELVIAMTPRTAHHRGWVEVMALGER